MSGIVNVFVLSFLFFTELVSGWDFAVTVKDEIEFFNINGSRAGVARQQFQQLSAITYDAVHQVVFFSDTRHENASIFSFHLTENRDIEHLVKRNVGHSVQGIAFDLVSGRLFWTDSNNQSIFWASLHPRIDSAISGDVLIDLKDESPHGIAVDSCRGMIYWTNCHDGKPTIERASVDSTDHEIIIKDNLYIPVGITVDQVNKKLYWVDDLQGIYFNIESSDLDGSNRVIVYHGTHHQPNSIVLNNDAIYWTDWVYKSVWKLPLDQEPNAVEPIKIKSFEDNPPIGIITRTDVLEQIQGVRECEKLEEVILNRTLIHMAKSKESEVKESSIITNVQTPVYHIKYCLNDGVLKHSNDDDEGIKVCDCPKGYSGYRCEVAVCQNYCFQGTCELTEAGLPSCRCVEGYQGERCQLDVCVGHCLNDGICEFSEKGRPMCRCRESWRGDRCEMPHPPPAAPKGSCNCGDSDQAERTKEDNSSSSYLQSVAETRNELLQEPSKCLNWDMREPLILGLMVLCLLFIFSTGMLAVKVVLLKRRPRIRKRIIVNKNVTPLTCRPEPPQCEITIENCCNMNICETPCFEPETLREQLREATKKEEKKNLLMNIERPDDMY